MWNSRLSHLQISADIGIQSISKQKWESIRDIEDIDRVGSNELSNLVTDNRVFEAFRKEDCNSRIEMPDSAEDFGP